MLGVNLNRHLYRGAPDIAHVPHSGDDFAEFDRLQEVHAVKTRGHADSLRKLARGRICAEVNSAEQGATKCLTQEICIRRLDNLG